jgi:hypothetical protein
MKLTELQIIRHRNIKYWELTLGWVNSSRDRMVVGFTTTGAITTKVVSSNPVHWEVYSIQY